MSRACIVGILVIAFTGGCTSLDYLGEPRRSTPREPVWDEERLAEHVKYLGGERAGGAGADGIAAKVAYVAVRMREFKLQPGVGRTWVVNYEATNATDGNARFTVGIPGDDAELSKSLAEGTGQVLGYVAGQDPALFDELILVCTRLGRPADVAALLALADQYAGFANFGSVPGRTILFAVFSRSGLSEYFRSPLWPVDRTRMVIYLGADSENREEVTLLVESARMKVRLIGPPQNDAVTEPDLVDALHMAQAAHAVLLSQASSAKPPAALGLQVPVVPRPSNQ